MGLWARAQCLARVQYGHAGLSETHSMSRPSPIPVIVWLQPEAPAKPAAGAPCNGCGLCCLTEPCPLGMVVSRRRTGACVALRWSEDEQRYRCAMVVDSGGVTGWTHPFAVRALSWLARRWIAAGVGCDARLSVNTPPETSAHDSLQ